MRPGRETACGHRRAESGEVAGVQRTHGGELGEMRQAIRLQGDRLDRVDGRLEGIEDTQRQILELLRDDRSGR